MTASLPYWEPISPDDGFIDLHLHTIHSDGRYTPQSLVAAAARKGLRAIAVTDHDTVSGIRETADFAAKAGIELLSGIEISTMTEEYGELHLLGYGIDPNHAGLRCALEHQKQMRLRRIEQVLERLSELGILISMETLLRQAGFSNSPGRPHIARAMIEAGYAASFEDAFHRYLGKGKPAFLAKTSMSHQQAIEIIAQSGGIPILAHPGLARKDNVIPALIDMGLRGLEVFHSEHAPEDARRYTEMVTTYGLLATGGSDCHGGKDDALPLIGTVAVPYALFSRLQACCAVR